MNFIIEESKAESATTTGSYNTDDKQTITFVYNNCKHVEHVLYNAKPSCAHKIQPQFSGIKCLCCGGWYCA